MNSGSMRIAYVMTIEQRLPPTLQNSFLELVLEPSFSLVKMLDAFVGSQREDFASVVFLILII